MTPEEYAAAGRLFGRLVKAVPHGTVAMVPSGSPGCVAYSWHGLANGRPFCFTVPSQAAAAIEERSAVILARWIVRDWSNQLAGFSLAAARETSIAAPPISLLPQRFA